MTEQNKQNDNGDQEPKSLNSADYQHRLLNKLNCLIAVLEVAIGKIRNSIDGDSGKKERLGKIRNNLENTLGICRRAKATLEGKIEKGVSSSATLNSPAELDTGTPRKKRPIGFRSYVELSSIEEFRKFKKMTPISDNELENVDLDDLAKRLGEI